ncbi:tripartite motif-containing protein 35 [Trichosurus vulpecula]|uniref:tripartite motif-containing protein 35 n=1 Tax=Trichosurus vulpecula TaxID=9337 RepID=UPI00186B3B42|nr:tripartite motif-containing protein 35 [Trichosurus vulpecula]
MEPGAGGSVGPSPSFKEELLCAICYDPFRDAVTLRCGHNFCRACVGRCWELQDAPVCPVCKERASPAGLRTNHTLNNLVEKLLREEACPARPRGPRFCRLHHGQLSLFCLDDKELLCGSCQGDPRHQGHRVQPVQGTARDYRAKCRNMEHSLREKAKAFRAMRRSYEAIVKHNQVEAAWLQGRIRQEFEKLREFLRVEERAALDAVTEEAGQKLRQVEEKMKQLAEETEALAHEIGRLQMEMKEDDISFLMKHKSRKRRLSCTTEPEPIQPGMLIDVSKYLDSLQYRVWKKMLSSIEAVPFSFDPNTAAGWLSVSDDLTKVTNHGYRVQVENPERFSSSPCLLGSRAFSHGSHTWEVDLGGLHNWRVGVARTRRESGGDGHSHSCYHDARSGFWYICRTRGADGDHCVASDPSASPLGPVLPQRLRVELECEEGELSFYDAERQAHLYTFHGRFGEVRPYFYIGGTRADTPPEPLRLCPLHIQVKEEL